MLIILVFVLVFIIACISTNQARKNPTDLPGMDNNIQMPVFNHSKNYKLNPDLDLEKQISLFRSQYKQSLNSKSLNSNVPVFQLKQGPILNISNITSNITSSSTSNLGPYNYYVYVAPNAPDGPGDPSNCDETSTIALSTCNLRSGWLLCDILVSNGLDECTQNDSEQPSVVACTVVLAAYSVNQLREAYGQSLSLLYTSPTSSCHAEFSVASSEPSMASSSFNTSAYPIVQGDTETPNMFIEIYSSSYFSIYLQSLAITGFGAGALSFIVIGTAKIEDCHFSDNGHNKFSVSIYIGPFGGAVLCDYCSLVDISRSSFSNNQLPLNITGGGGSVAILTTPAVVISSSVFTGNAADQGGAILCHECSAMSITGSSFHNNSAGSDGGAIYYFNSGYFNLPSDSFELENSLFTENSALRNGGSVYLQFTSSLGSVRIVSSTFNNNTAQFNGGALMVISIEPFLYVLVRFSSFSNNIAVSDFGGAVCFIQSCPNIDSCQFIKNSAIGNGGGAIYLRGPSESIYMISIFMYIDNCVMDDNTAYFGGALLTDTWVTVYVATSIFSSNSAVYGGAIANYLVCVSSTIHTVFNNNIASYGGASIDIGGDTSFSLLSNSNVDYYSNTAKITGGAISVSNFFTATISDCTFRSNSAMNGGGGGAHFQYIVSALETSSTAFDSCTAYKGGAFYVQNSQNVSISNCQFENNRAFSSGGAAYFDQFNSFIGIESSEFIRNIAAQGSGGALYFAGSNKYISIGGFLPTLQIISDPDFIAVRENPQIEKKTFTVDTSGGDRFYVAFDPTTILNSKLGYLGTNFFPLEVTIQNMSSTVLNNESVPVSVPLITTNFTGVDVAEAYLKHILHSLPGYGANLPLLLHGTSLVIDYKVSSSYIALQVYPFNSNHYVLFQENSAHLFGGAVHFQKSNQHIFMVPNVVFENNWVYYFGTYDDDTHINSILKGTTKLADDDSHKPLNKSIIAVDDYLESFSSLTDTGDPSVKFVIYGGDGVGGALSFYQSNTNINILSVLFNFNFAGYGGAVAIFQSNSYINIYNCNFTANLSDGKDGGALYLGSSNLHIGKLICFIFIY